MPLFANLEDGQLGCIEPGEVIEAPVGTMLASDGEQNGHFLLFLEGEARIHRVYDRRRPDGSDHAGKLHRRNHDSAEHSVDINGAGVQSGAIIPTERTGFLANAVDV